MNNIYKVIWSKAKNCYVVASEIARSHTKSASGSEKIGGVTRRSLLASLMALSLVCGGLGVASASLEVLNQSGTPGAVEIYTKDEVDNALTAKGAATEVAANKTDIANLKTAVGDAGSGLTKAVADQNADIATNKANITALQNELGNKADKTALNNKADKATTLAGYGITDAYTKDEVNNALNDKANKTTVNTLVGHVGDLETTVGNASSGLVKEVNDLKAQGNTLNTALGNKADQADLDTANGKITDLQKKTVKLSDDGTKLTGMTTVSGATVSGDNVEAGALKVTGEISNGAGVTTTLDKIDASMKQTATNTGNITNLKTKTDGQQTAINGLNEKTTKITYDAALGTNVDGVTFNAGAVTGVTSINGTEIGTKESGTYIHQDSSIWGNMKNVDTQVGKNTTAITKLEDKVGTVGTGTYLAPTESIGENLGRLDAGLKQEVDDRTAADNDLSDRIGTVTDDGNYIKKSATNNVSENLKVLDTQAKNNAEAIKQETADRKAAIGELAVDGNYIKKDKNVSDNLVELDKQAKTNADAITETNQRTHGITRNDIRNETSIEGKVTVDTDGNIKAEGTITSNGLNAGDGDIKTNGTVSAGNVSTGTLETTGDATIGRDLTVKGILHTKDVTAETIHISKSEDNTVYKSEGSIVGEGGNLSVHNEKTYKSTNITKESELNVNEEGTVNWATSKDNATGNVTEGRSEVKADNIKNYVKKTEGGTTFGYEENIKETGKVGTATDKDGNTNELTQTATGTENTVTSKDGNRSTTKQEAGSISSTVYDKDGNIKASSEMKEDGSISNNATGDMTNTVGGNQTNTIGGNQTTTVEGNVKEDYKHDLTTTVGGNESHEVKGNQTNTIGGDQTTNVTGNISNKAKNITNEAETKLTDKVGDHTRVLDNEGITDTVGGSTFKQRIDKIMMESKDVSIKAEETLTNEAKVITNKASEVINNEAININNTATGIITSKASEIKNQADKLISNKVGENTWENMEDGKITTSIKDGAKQNLTQSDAAGTTQSTVDGAKSTVTIQNTDGLVGAVTDGTNTSLQNQTASAIATDVKDGAGNENASVANATTSANTIKNGTKANTVISTADGTSFINSEAATPVGAGTADRTTIKGNTITTGKVTMDYADVMKDLGVRGNANITGKTTTGSLEVKGESKLTGNVTMESNATVKKDLNVEGITTTKTLKVTENAEVGGELKVAKKATFKDSVDIARDLTVGGNATIAGDVTANSYKVGDKTYIDADGIHANNQKITNVADGSISEGSKDAVNGGQLYGVKRDLEHQVDKVGANAAAMANLRPMEFDPSSKWNIAAAIGNYGSETAAALGAFYRPNDDVMVNLSTAFGTGENMVGGGVSVRLGKGSNKLSREESNALKDQVNDLTARMDALLSVLNPNMSKDFPDVPENHWAYEAVSRLAGNDIVQGYPDGEFHGERTMTRYEMAEIIYNALSRGAEAERELVEEFKPELQAMAASEKATAEKAEG